MNAENFPSRFDLQRQAMLREWSADIHAGLIDHATALQEIRATQTGMAALMALYDEEMLDV